MQTRKGAGSKVRESLSLNWMCTVNLQSKEVGAPFSSSHRAFMSAAAKQHSGS